MPPSAGFPIRNGPNVRSSARDLALKEGCTVSDREIKESLQGYARSGVISRDAVADPVVFVDAIRRTSVGKLDKKLLREQVATFCGASAVMIMPWSTRRCQQRRCGHWVGKYRIRSVKPSLAALSRWPVTRIISISAPI
jgi:hypothetical protein